MQMDWNYPEIIALHSEATTLIFGFRGDPFDFLANRPNVKKKTDLLHAVAGKSP